MFRGVYGASGALKVLIIACGLYGAGSVLYEQRLNVHVHSGSGHESMANWRALEEMASRAARFA